MTNLTLPYDVETIRADFPILNQEHHAGVPLVYLDNAASSQKPQQVIDTIGDYYSRYNANVHRGIHKLSEAATFAYEEARIKVKKFINAASKREIIFTRGTTESINLVAQTWGRANLKQGDVVVSTQMEHHSNIVPWQILAAEKGFTIRYIPVLDDGTLDMNFLATVLRDEPVKLVTVMHVSNVLGTINPIEEIIRQAHAAGALILVDGAQSVPHMPVDVQALDIDFLAFSGHKMCGPTGAGALWARYELLDAMPPFHGGGEMIMLVKLDRSTYKDPPLKFEAGTMNIADSIVFGTAVDYLREVGMESVRAHEKQLTAHTLAQLREVDGLRVFGPD